MQVEFELFGPNGEENYIVNCQKIQKIPLRELTVDDILLGKSFDGNCVTITKWDSMNAPEEVAKYKFLRYRTMRSAFPSTNLSYGVYPNQSMMIFANTNVTINVKKNGFLVDQIALGPLNLRSKKNIKSDGMFTITIPTNYSGLLSLKCHEQGPFYWIHSFDVSDHKLSQYAETIRVPIVLAF